MNRKAIFIHDGPRWKDDSGQQFGTSTDVDMYNRYKYLGTEVEFAMRVFKVQDTSRLTNLNKLGLKISEIIPFNRPALLKNYFRSKKQIEAVVDSADIIIVRLPSTIGSVAVKYAKKINKPCLIEVVACPWDALTNHSFLGKIYAVFSRNKLRKLVQDAKFVTYVTTHFLQKRYPTNGVSMAVSDVMLKSVSESDFENKQKAYESFSPENVINIATLAAVDVPYKGHDLVFKAIEKLKADGIKIKYHIAGKGDFKRLQEIADSLGINDSINYIGSIDHTQVFDLLSKIDIYVQPSQQEGLPRALVEAMSRGCACIGSDVGGIPELLDEKAIFKSKNVVELTARIRSFVNKDILLEQSRKNFEEAKNYKYENLESKRKAFYDKFLESINGK